MEARSIQVLLSRHISIVAVSLILYGCLVGAALSDDVIRTYDSIWKKAGSPVESLPPEVSIIQLLANPETYHSRLLRVRGFVTFGEEESALHYTREHADVGLPQDTLWLSIDPSIFTRSDLERFDRSYVLVQGVFDKDLHGHLSRSSFGTVRDITGIFRVPVRTPSKQNPR